MISDGYNHFLVNPSALVVGGPPASTPAAAPESAIQRLLGGAPELLDRISEQAAHKSFQDPLEIYYRDIENLYDDPYHKPNGSLITWWVEHGRHTYTYMLADIENKLNSFRLNVMHRSPLGDNFMTIPHVMDAVYHSSTLERLIYGIRRNEVIPGDRKSYHYLYKSWKELRDKMGLVLNSDLMVHTRITGNLIIKNIDDTFTSMRQLLLSMATGPIPDPGAPLTQQYVGKRNLTERILKGKPQTPSQ